MKQKKVFLLSIILFLLFLFVVLGLYRRVYQARYESRTELMLGTFCTIVLGHSNRDLREAAFEKAFASIRMYEKELSVFSDSSMISLINQRAGFERVNISPQIEFLLRESIMYSSLSDGAFDITTLPLSKLWGFMGTKQRVPTEEEIKETRYLIGYENIMLTQKNDLPAVYFKKTGMQIDLGAIAKGFICDELMRGIRASGIDDVMVNIGGNIRVHGNAKYGRPWKIGIQNPRDKSAILMVITLKDMAVSTSGDYEQFFMHEDKRYAHVINPRTGYPVENNVLGVTVVTSSAMAADALSTACFVLGVDASRKMLKNVPYQAIYFVVLSNDKVVLEEL